MDITFRIAIVLIVLVLYVHLGRKACGSLKLSRLSIMSTLFYYMLVMNLIGISLAYIGVSEHYGIHRIRPLVDRTFYVVVYTLLVFFATVIITNKFCTRKSQKRSFEEFITKPVLYHKDMTGAQAGTLFLMVIGFLAMAYTFAILGYIPITRMFTSSSYAIAVMRQRANRNFTGNVYIKNIMMKELIPFISYYAYIWYRATSSRTWRSIWIILFVLSILVVTHDFSKSPSVKYLISYYLINISLGTVNDNKQFIKLGIISTVIILFFYLVMLNVDFVGIDWLYGGPVGRILFSQISPMGAHLATFPDQHPFLYGASFNKWLSFIIPTANDVRSARVVMETFNPEGVAEGTAGVMNTIFVGEAYANFGMFGIVIAPILFGVIIASVSNILLKVRKRPETVLLYLWFNNFFSTTVEGGFIDLFYNAGYIIIPCWIIWLTVSSHSHYPMSKYSPKRKNPRPRRIVG